MGAVVIRSRKRSNRPGVPQCPFCFVEDVQIQTEPIKANHKADGFLRSDFPSVRIGPQLRRDSDLVFALSPFHVAEPLERDHQLYWGCCLAYLCEENSTDANSRRVG